MIPLPKDYERIEGFLKDRSLTGSEASNLLYAARTRLGPPWHWREWKAARSQIIGSCCAECGTQEGIMTLQHTFRLPSLGDLVQKAKLESDYHDELVRQKEQIEAGAELSPRPCCPICAGTSIYFRKNTKTWMCISKKHGRACGHVFDTPGEVMAATPEEKRAVSQRKNAAWRALKGQRRDEWIREGILRWCEDMRRYLSLQDTETLCKRCAFLADKTRMKACLSCSLAFDATATVCPRCATERSKAASTADPDNSPDAPQDDVGRVGQA
nr:hypothetical protein [Paracoccus saliphilus]